MKLRLVGTVEQREIVLCDERFLTVMAGRRWGKSYTVRNRILHRCLGNGGFKYWYVAPVYSQAREQYEAISGHPSLAGVIDSHRLQPYPVVRFVNGSEVAFRSFERPKNLRGSGLDEVWCDEIQDIQEDYFWPVVRPLISDRRGVLGISGQFRGHNWYYKQLYTPGVDGKKGYRAWRFPSSTGLVYLSASGKEELESAKAQLPKVIFDQEYECVPVANQAAVFDPDDLEAIQQGPALSRGSGCIVSIDIGRVADPSAIVVIDPSSGTVIHSELRRLKEKHEVTAKAFSDVCRKYQHSCAFADTTGGATGGHKPQDEVLRYYRESVPDMREFVWNRNNKERIIQSLALGIESRELKVPRENKELLDQLGLYEFEYRGGGYDYHGPGGHKDDLVAALAMAWYAYKRGLNRTGYGHINSVL